MGSFCLLITGLWIFIYTPVYAFNGVMLVVISALLLGCGGKLCFLGKSDTKFDLNTGMFSHQHVSKGRHLKLP